MLGGTIRDHVTQQRRPILRFFVGEQNLSHEPPASRSKEGRFSHIELWLWFFMGFMD
jgi:hypothetical protein